MSPLDLLGPVCTQSFTSYSELIFNLFSYLREANNKFLRVITTLNHCFDLRQQAIGPLEPYVGKGAPYIFELPPPPYFVRKCRKNLFNQKNFCYWLPHHSFWPSYGPWPTDKQETCIDMQKQKLKVIKYSKPLLNNFSFCKHTFIIQ